MEEIAGFEDRLAGLKERGAHLVQGCCDRVQSRLRQQVQAHQQGTRDSYSAICSTAQRVSEEEEMERGREGMQTRRRGRRDGWEDEKDLYSLFEEVKWFLYIYHASHRRHGVLGTHIFDHVSIDHTCVHRHTLYISVMLIFQQSRHPLNPNPF